MNVKTAYIMVFTNNPVLTRKGRPTDTAHISLYKYDKEMSQNSSSVQSGWMCFKSPGSFWSIINCNRPN